MLFPDCAVRGPPYNRGRSGPLFIEYNLDQRRGYYGISIGGYVGYDLDLDSSRLLAP